MSQKLPIWHKYFWKMKNGNINGLYSVETDIEFFHCEIIFIKNDINSVNDVILMNKKTFDNKWQKYFYEEEMLGIHEMIRLDKIVWNDVRKK